MVLDVSLYYRSNRDEEVRPRLSVPNLIPVVISREAHYDMGHGY